MQHLTNVDSRTWDRPRTCGLEDRGSLRWAMAMTRIVDSGTEDHCVGLWLWLESKWIRVGTSPAIFPIGGYNYKARACSGSPNSQPDRNPTGNEEHRALSRALSETESARDKVHSALSLSPFPRCRSLSLFDSLSLSLSLTLSLSLSLSLSLVGAERPRPKCNA